MYVYLFIYLFSYLFIYFITIGFYHPISLLYFMIVNMTINIKYRYVISHFRVLFN